MKMLIVCGRNRIRCLTPGHHLAGRPRHAVRSAGTVPPARARVPASHLGRAGVAVVMVNRHRGQLAPRFGDDLAGKLAVGPRIPNDVTNGDQGLLELIGAGGEPPLDPAVARAGAVTP